MKWQQIKNDFILQIDSDDFMWHQLQEAGLQRSKKFKERRKKRLFACELCARQRRKNRFFAPSRCKWMKMQKDNHTQDIQSLQ
jgi:hypothetical protein